MTPEKREDDRMRWAYAIVPKKLGEGATGPLVPVYAASFAGATPALIGVMEAAHAGLSVLGAFVWGRTSDEARKRKPFIVLGFLGTFATLAGLSLAPSFWGVFAWRALQGFVMAAFAAVGGALVADTATPERLAGRMGHLNMIGGFGYVAGLLVGAGVALLRPTRDLFALAALFSLLSTALAVWWIHEPEAHLRRRDVYRLFRNVTGPFLGPIQRRTFSPDVLLYRPKLTAVERRAWSYLGAIFVVFLGTSSGFVLFPIYLTELGLTPTHILLLFVVNATLSALLYRPAGRMADRLGFRKLQLGAIGTRSFMFLLLALPFSANVTAAVVFLLLAGASWAVLNTTGPTALFRGMQIRQKGELVGLYTAAAGLGSLTGALVGGVLAQLLGFQSLFLVASTLVAVGLVITATAVYPRTGT